MKQLLLVCLLLSNNLVKADPQVLAVTDTAKSHAQLVAQLSDDMCSQVANGPSKAFDKMGTVEAYQLADQLFTVATRHNNKAAFGLLHEIKQQNSSPAARDPREHLREEILLSLGQRCSVAKPLVTRLDQLEKSRQRAFAKAPKLTDVEVQILALLAEHMCLQLIADANEQNGAKHDFAKVPVAQRNDVFRKRVQDRLEIDTYYLQDYYSKAKLSQPQFQEEITWKLAAFMLNRQACPEYAQLLNFDSVKTVKTPVTHR